MSSNFMTIFTKEFKEVIRDRRTLIFMLIMPSLMMPVILSIAVEFAKKAEKKAQTETITYAIIGKDLIPSLTDEFASAEGFEYVDVASEDELPEAINAGTIKMGLVYPVDSAEVFNAGGQANVRLYYNNASQTSRIKRRASSVIDDFSEKVQKERLANLGVSGITGRAAILDPVEIDEKGTADMREVIGEAVGGMLPYLFIIFCFLGALYPAIDLGAGEKERGTLETLLLTPVSRTNLVLGKFFVVFTTGCTAALLSLAGLGGWLFTQGKEVTGAVGEIIESVGVMDLVMIGGMMVPIAAIFAAMLISISIFARNFKEAQSYATPFNFICIMPAVLAMLPGIELNWTWAMVPITNVALAMKELVKGTMDYTMFVAILGSTTVIAGGMLAFCTKWFQKESVLFRG